MQISLFEVKVNSRDFQTRYYVRDRSSGTVLVQISSRFAWLPPYGQTIKFNRSDHWIAGLWLGSHTVVYDIARTERATGTDRRVFFFLFLIRILGWYMGTSSPLRWLPRATWDGYLSRSARPLGALLCNLFYPLNLPLLRAPRRRFLLTWNFVRLIKRGTED